MAAAQWVYNHLVVNVTLLPVLMVVAVGVLYGTFDLLRKRLTGKLPPAALLVWLALGQVPLFALLVWGGQGAAPGSDYWLPGLASILLNIIANLMFLRALEIATLGVTVPLLSLTPVFATLLSIELLGELPTPIQWVGIVLAVVGAFTLNLEPGAGASPATVWRALTREKGSLLMIGVALCWSITPPFDKLAAEASSVYVHGMLLNGGVGLGALLWLLARGEAASLRPRGRAAGALAASAVVGFVALVLLLKAYGLVWVGFVETVRRAVNSALAVALGYWLLDETVSRSRIAGVVLMSLGVALIFL